MGGGVRIPPPPVAMPLAPSLSEQAASDAKLMQRRRELGLSGRLSTFLTDTTAASEATLAANAGTLLGSYQGKEKPLSEFEQAQDMYAAMAQSSNREARRVGRAGVGSYGSRAPGPDRVQPQPSSLLGG